MRKNTVLFSFVFLLSLLVIGCKSQPVAPVVEEGPTAEEVVQKLYVEYKAGQIERCTYQGETIYKCSRNAPDGGSEIFDASGDKMGGCYYNTGALHAACEGSTDCKVIYRVAKNIWGKPGVELIK